MRSEIAVGGTAADAGTVAARVEVGIHRVLTLFAIAYALASVDGYLSDRHLLVGAPGAVLQASIGSALVVLAASLVLRAARRRLQVSAVALFGLAYALAPAAVLTVAPLPQYPWLTKLALSVVAALAVVAPNPAVATLGGGVLALEVAALSFRSGTAPGSVAASAMLVLVPTVLMTCAVTALRRRARRVEQVRAESLRTFAALELERALEQERVRTDALLTDSILMTLLAGADVVDSADSVRAVSMARAAHAVIVDATRPSAPDPVVGGPRSAGELVR